MIGVNGHLERVSGEMRSSSSGDGDRRPEGYAVRGGVSRVIWVGFPVLCGISSWDDCVEGPGGEENNNHESAGRDMEGDGLKISSSC